MKLLRKIVVSTKPTKEERLINAASIRVTGPSGVGNHHKSMKYLGIERGALDESFG